MKRLVWLLLLVAVPAWTATRYGSPTGTGVACSSGTPCDMATCISGMTTTDNVCELASGAYSSPGSGTSGIQLPVSCTSGSPCTIRAASKWGPVITILAGDACSIGGYTGYISTGNAVRNYWTIYGLDFVVDGYRTNTDRYCNVLGFYNSSNINVTDVRVTYHGGTGVNEVSTGSLVAANYITTLTIDGAVYDRNASCVNSSDCPGAYNNDCDMFDTSVFSIGNSTTVTITRSDLRHQRRGAAISNTATVNFTKNICINIGNHSCLATEDVSNLLMENNFIASDQDPACNDQIMQGAMSDHYCLNSAIIRNNTIRGYSYGFAQAFQLYGSGSSNCNDGGSPDTGNYCQGGTDDGLAKCGTDVPGPTGNNTCTTNGGTCIDYRAVKYYNNSTDHVGANAAFFCQDVGTGDFAAGASYTEDYNLLYGCPTSNTKIGYDPSSCAAGTPGAGICNSTEWGSTLGDVDGDGIHENVNGLYTAPVYSTATAVTTSSYSGGGTYTYYGIPDSTSPATNAGTNTTAANGVSTPCATEDFFGAARTGTCDIGAFQDGGSSPATTRRRAHITVPKK